MREAMLVVSEALGLGLGREQTAAVLALAQSGANPEGIAAALKAAEEATLAAAQQHLKCESRK